MSIESNDHRAPKASTSHGDVADTADRILRRPEVERVVGACERAIRDWEANGQFPRRFQLAPDGRAVGWLESEVMAWLAKRAASRGTAAE